MFDGVAEKYDLTIGVCAHAGDGNTHPTVCFDAADPDESRRARESFDEVAAAALALGGTITGEHGVGVEKRDLMPVMFNEDDLNQQQRVKCAFDPDQILNPGKVFPTLHRCAELGRMHIHRGQLPHPDLPRF